MVYFRSLVSSSGTKLLTSADVLPAYIGNSGLVGCELAARRLSVALGPTICAPEQPLLSRFSMTQSKKRDNLTASVVPAAKLRVSRQLSQISSAPHLSAARRNTVTQITSGQRSIILTYTASFLYSCFGLTLLIDQIQLGAHYQYWYLCGA